MYYMYEKDKKAQNYDKCKKEDLANMDTESSLENHRPNVTMMMIPAPPPR